MSKRNDPIKEYARNFHHPPALANCFYPKEPKNKLTWKDIPARDVAIDHSDFRNEPTVVKKQQPVELKPLPPRTGYVYYATDGNGKIKIGFSVNPWSRCIEMRTCNPDLKLVAVEKGTIELERLRHIEFKDDHLALEWFKQSEKLQQLIESLKSTGQ